MEIVYEEKNKYWANKKAEKFEYSSTFINNI